MSTNYIQKTIPINVIYIPILPNAIPTTIPVKHYNIDLSTGGKKNQTKIPTIIQTMISTTISTTLPNTIFTTLPNTIFTTLPTTIPTIIQNTIYINDTLILTINNYKTITYIIDKTNEEQMYQEFPDVPMKNSFSKFASLKYLKNNNINCTSIDLGYCENLLREAYNFSDDVAIYTLIIEIKEEGMKIPKIEYEVYYLNNSNKLIQMDLSICLHKKRRLWNSLRKRRINLRSLNENNDNDIKIKVLIPVEINDNIEIHNSSGGYYNDPCYTTTSQYGTDICLKDRRNEFIDNNLTLCEENCDLIGYDYLYQKSICLCEIKIKLPLLNEVKFDKERLKNNFIDINNIMNIKFLNCYKVAYRKENIIHNLGFYILGSIVCLFLICLFLFYYKYYKLLVRKIDSIFFDTKNNTNKENNKINKSNNNITKINDANKNNINKIKNLITSDKEDQLKDNDLNNDKKIKKIIKKNKQKKVKGKKNKKNKYKNKKNEYKNNLNEGISDIIPIKKTDGIIPYDPNSNNNLNNSENKNIDNNNDKAKENFSSDYDDSELNSLPYKGALDHDKRSYTQYYISLLKTNHLLIFSFYPFKDYNSQIIKIFLFFFCFASDLVINALFFTDATMNKIYYDKGSFDFIYNIPQIIYSLLISIVINAIIKFLSLSEKKVISVKEDLRNNSKNLDTNIKELFKVLKIKFTLFFIITFIILIIYWFYITCFCGIYKNTQIHLIKDTISSFFTSLLYPFGLLLLPGIFRRCALKSKKKDKKLLYKFSQLLENL